jgi:hypothetical protein
MNTIGTTFRFIFYRIFSESPIIGMPFLYSLDIDQLRNLIQCNKQHRIILVCKADYIEELYNTIIECNIHEIFTLGDCTELSMKDKEITMINTNEQDLMFHVLCEAIRYTHREEIIHRQQENHGLANVFAMDILKLLEQAKILL